ncbi:MAG: hypothetical protein NTY50_08850 [Methylobacter sp.]|nr:hypothetical protein [Methylobacter sp.]
MLEIQPVLPSLPVVKPKKIKEDDNSKNKQQPEKRPSKQQTAKPVQHIDEIV